jgi:hypothetical protein
LDALCSSSRFPLPGRGGEPFREPGEDHVIAAFLLCVSEVRRPARASGSIHPLGVCEPARHPGPGGPTREARRRMFLACSKQNLAGPGPGCKRNYANIPKVSSTPPPPRERLVTRGESCKVRQSLPEFSPPMPGRGEYGSWR